MGLANEAEPVAYIKCNPSHKFHAALVAFPPVLINSAQTCEAWGRVGSMTHSFCFECAILSPDAGATDQPAGPDCLKKQFSWLSSFATGRSISHWLISALNAVGVRCLFCRWICCSVLSDRMSACVFHCTQIYWFWPLGVNYVFIRGLIKPWHCSSARWRTRGLINSLKRLFLILGILILNYHSTVLDRETNKFFLSQTHIIDLVGCRF